MSFLSFSFSLFKIFFIFFFSFNLSAVVEDLIPLLIRRFPHSVHSFTQGLAIDSHDHLYESVGLYGSSCVHEINLLTGQVNKTFELPVNSFGEGIAIVGNHLIQLTWKERKAYVYDLSLNPLHQFSYEGEGWGLCADGENVWMSNGSSILTQRDAKTFKMINTIEVKLNGKPCLFLNDLECVNEHIYANVWHQEWILKIDKNSGDVVGKIDTQSLLTSEERKSLSYESVLNGIAYRPSNKTFILTGKQWSQFFEVQFVPRSP